MIWVACVVVVVIDLDVVVLVATNNNAILVVLCRRCSVFVVFVDLAFAIVSVLVVLSL